MSDDAVQDDGTSKQPPLSYVLERLRLVGTPGKWGALGWAVAGGAVVFCMGVVLSGGATSSVVFVLGMVAGIAALVAAYAHGASHSVQQQGRYQPLADWLNNKPPRTDSAAPASTATVHLGEDGALVLTVHEAVGGQSVTVTAEIAAGQTVSLQSNSPSTTSLVLRPPSVVPSADELSSDL